MREENVPIILSYIHLLVSQDRKIYARNLITQGCPFCRSALQVYINYLVEQGVLKRIGQRRGYSLICQTTALRR